jgi:cytochrome c oxidase cbb3-type subunit III
MIPRWVLLFVACSLASAQGQNPFTGNPKEIEVGRATFRIYCSPCHGIQAQGGRGPDLTSGIYGVGNSDQALYDVIVNGIPGTEMPASAPPRMTSDSVWRVVAYLRSIANRERPSLAGDPKAGEEIFWSKAQCGSCHQVGIRGGRLGPDLSGVGRARSLAYLREAVVAPGTAITPGYATISVVTATGERITGVERIFDNFSVLLMDSQENLHSFLRSEVQSVKKEQRSLMPGYGEALSANELEDLISYLAGLGREEASQ